MTRRHGILALDQGSVTAGTVFHGTRAALQVWFLGIFFLSRHKKGASPPRHGRQRATACARSEELGRKLTSEKRRWWVTKRFSKALGFRYQLR